MIVRLFKLGGEIMLHTTRCKLESELDAPRTPRRVSSNRDLLIDKLPPLGFPGCFTGYSGIHECPDL